MQAVAVEELPLATFATATVAAEEEEEEEVEDEEETPSSSSLWFFICVFLPTLPFAPTRLFLRVPPPLELSSLQVESSSGGLSASLFISNVMDAAFSILTHKQAAGV